MATPKKITRTLVPEDQRAVAAGRAFGAHFARWVEPTVYTFAHRLSESYSGGLWRFYTLSNQGFYMAPDTEESFPVQCPNGFEGELSADAFGITVCLYAYSHLSFSEEPMFGEHCGKHYHRLREYMLGHPEAGAILSAID